ncbi:MAG: fibrobacter succinogenes major paralogous domain-containing protein, partial [Prevotellaceae bacterium]|nr:fibrobacter succinogenes major paralogous domain-containing protein [Prevotellaceae bacterium]
MTENTHRYKVVTPCAWSGFGAVPAGWRNNNGSQFSNRGTNVFYWSSSVGSSTNAWNRQFNSGNAQVNRNLNSRSNGLSVRCVRESIRNKRQRTDFFGQRYTTLHQNPWKNP